MPSPSLLLSLLLAASFLVRRGLYAAASENVNSNNCAIKSLTSVSPQILAAFRDYPDDFPLLSPAEPFRADWLLGRYYVVETSAPTQEVVFQCDCPILDTGFADGSGTASGLPSYYSMTSAYPRVPSRSLVVNDLALPYNWTFGFPLGNVFTDYNAGVYHNFIVKVGPDTDDMGYAYYVLAVTYTPWLGDVAPPGLPLPNGTVSFEVYARDVKEYKRLYKSQVREYVQGATASAPPGVQEALALLPINQTACRYAYEPPFVEQSREEARRYVGASGGDSASSSSWSAASRGTSAATAIGGRSAVFLLAVVGALLVYLSESETCRRIDRS